MICGLAQTLLARPEKPPTRAELRCLATHARRACRVIHNALNRRRARPAGDVNHALVRAVRAAGFRKQDVRASLAPGLPLAAVFPDEMETIFSNVLLNARRAMKASPSPQVLLESSKKGKMITVTISDTGSGIARERLAKIFEPFHTFAADASGTGLGLFITQRMLARRGGSVNAAARAGGGAVFSIELPVARSAGSKARQRTK